MKLTGVQTWTSADGQTSPIVQWQHTFIAIGYDDDLNEGSMYLIDAYDAGTKSFTYTAFDTAWAQMERLAVIVQGPIGQSHRWQWRTSPTNGFIVDGRWEIDME
jgi:hypothetical protein